MLDAIADAFVRGGARLLDVHSDVDHHRSVFTLAGEPGAISEALVCGAREAVARIDLNGHAGVHPRVGAIDVAPVVHLDEEDRGPACAEALVTADRLAEELDLPVFLYGVLADGRTRAELRRGGPERLAARIAAGEQVPDFGPPRLHPTAGAVLVTARPPLVAFNLELEAPTTLEEARMIASCIREGGEAGLPGLRALGLRLESTGAIQVSTNIEDHRRTTAAEVVEAVRRYASVAAAELVALAPEAALAGFPDDVPIVGFEPQRHVIERALRREFGS